MNIKNLGKSSFQLGNTETSGLSCSTKASPVGKSWKLYKSDSTEYTHNQHKNYVQFFNLCFGSRM